VLPARVAPALPGSPAAEAAEQGPEGQWPEIAIRARACHEAASPPLATCSGRTSSKSTAASCRRWFSAFTDDSEACIAHLRFPLRHRKEIRTTNLLERLFLEERRRTRIIPHAFGERAVLTLMYAAMIRAADRWRGITVGEFSSDSPARFERNSIELTPSARARSYGPTRVHRPSEDPARLGLDPPAYAQRPLGHA
jgi:hypothetical protein